MFDKSKPFNTLIGTNPEGHVVCQDGVNYTRAEVDAAHAEPVIEAVVVEEPKQTEAPVAADTAPVAQPVIEAVVAEKAE